MKSIRDTNDERTVQHVRTTLEPDRTFKGRSIRYPVAGYSSVAMICRK